MQISKQEFFINQWASIISEYFYHDQSNIELNKDIIDSIISISDRTTKKIVDSINFRSLNRKRGFQVYFGYLEELKYVELIIIFHNGKFFLSEFKANIIIKEEDEIDNSDNRRPSNQKLSLDFYFHLKYWR